MASPAAHAAVADPYQDPYLAGDVPLVNNDGGSAYRFRASERCFLKRINHRRQRHGLKRLSWDYQLGYVARSHAETLAAYQGVWHDPEAGNKVTRWIRLAQNTGKGRNCRSLIRAFTRSSGHRANILGQFRHVGVGTAWSGGRMYVQQLFESRRDPGNVYSYP